MSLRPSYLAASELPPRPDPQTGQPMPPHAPGFIGTTAPDPRGRILDPAQAPAPPPGQGQVLAWYKSSRRGALLLAVGIFALITAGVFAAQGFSIRWMTIWWIWPLIGLFSVGGYFTRSMVEVSAGADWLQYRRHWVKTYDLANVTTYYRGNNYWIRLHDRDGHAINVSVSHIQENREVWDLLYNGILHSVITGGAETNGHLHGVFHVPRPYPAIE